jgi:hypothetical protein
MSINNFLFLVFGGLIVIFIIAYLISNAINKNKPLPVQNLHVKNLAYILLSALLIAIDVFAVAGGNNNPKNLGFGALVIPYVIFFSALFSILLGIFSYFLIKKFFQNNAPILFIVALVLSLILFFTTNYFSNLISTLALF